MMETHLTPEQVTALLEGQAPDAVMAHAKTCARCAARFSNLKDSLALAKELPTADARFLSRVLEGLARNQTAPRRPLAWLVYALPTAAVLALGVVNLEKWNTPGLVARGSGAPLNAVEVQATQVLAGTRVSLHNGSTVPAARLVLQVSLSALPAEPAAVAVCLRDAAGAVTWLLPRWSQGAPAPPCIPTRHEPVHAVETTQVPPLASGEAQLLMVRWPASTACSITAMDEALEGGAMPQSGAGWEAHTVLMLHVQ